MDELKGRGFRRTVEQSNSFHNYKKYNSQMILRDYLALDRTVLANERTLLAYVRTFLGFLATGAGIIKLFGTPVALAAGYILIVISPVLLVFGVARYLRMRRKLRFPHI